MKKPLPVPSMRIPLHLQGWFWVLVAISIAAAAIGVYAALKLDKTETTCAQLNRVIVQQNIRGEVLGRLLLNAAKTREASALLESTSPEQRRIDQRAAYLYRLDADLIVPTDKLKC